MGSKMLNSKITALKRYDNKAVHLTSTFAISFPLDNCERFDRKMKQKIEVPRLFIVKDHNTHMGGVDLHDQLTAYYRKSFK